MRKGRSRRPAKLCRACDEATKDRTNGDTLIRAHRPDLQVGPSTRQLRPRPEDAAGGGGPRPPPFFSFFFLSFFSWGGGGGVSPGGSPPPPPPAPGAMLPAVGSSRRGWSFDEALGER